MTNDHNTEAIKTFLASLRSIAWNVSLNDLAKKLDKSPDDAETQRTFLNLRHLSNGIKDFDLETLIWLVNTLTEAKQ